MFAAILENMPSDELVIHDDVTLRDLAHGEVQL